jgi:MoxR-like ATPase
MKAQQLSFIGTDTPVIEIKPFSKPAAKPPVEVSRDGDTWTISGDTYPHRVMLKAEGCKWDWANKVWTYTGETLPERVAALAVIEGPACAVTPQAQPAGNFIKPVYWSDLCAYLTPGASRPAVALVGPAGNGKTTAAEAVCEAMGHDYVVIDATEYLEPADLVGAMTYDPALGEVWRDGPVAKAFREGRAVIINEFDALNPRAALCLQSVCQDPGSSGRGRYVTLPGNPDEDRVFPSGDCPLIVTMNTFGTGATREYVGRNAMDAATADRFTIIATGYEHEAEILKLNGYSSQTARRLAEWAAVMRNRIEREALRVILSMRTLLRMAQAIERYGWTFDDAVEKEFLGRVDPDTRALLA